MWRKRGEIVIGMMVITERSRNGVTNCGATMLTNGRVMVPLNTNCKRFFCGEGKWLLDPIPFVFAKGHSGPIFFSIYFYINKIIILKGISISKIHIKIEISLEILWIIHHPSCKNFVVYRLLLQEVFKHFYL